MHSELKSADSAHLSQFMPLFFHHQRGLYQYLVVLVGNTHDADDLMQELSLGLWEQFEQFELGTDFAAWARKIAYFRVQKYWRQRGRRPQLVDGGVLELLAAETEADEVAPLAPRSALEHCLAKLRETDRQLIDRRYNAGDSVRQISKMLGRPANSVSKSLGRIRRRLLDCIQRTLDAENHLGEDVS